MSIVARAPPPAGGLRHRPPWLVDAVLPLTLLRGFRAGRGVHLAQRDPRRGILGSLSVARSRLRGDPTRTHLPLQGLQGLQGRGPAPQALRLHAQTVSRWLPSCLAGGSSGETQGQRRSPATQLRATGPISPIL